jgi:hypothetical protein
MARAAVVSPLGQMDPRLAHGEVVGRSEMRGRRQMALAQQQQHLGGSNFRGAMGKGMVAHERFGLIQHSDCAGHSPAASFRRASNIPVDAGVSALSICGASSALCRPCCLRGLEVVPLVEDTGQAKIRFARSRQAAAHLPSAEPAGSSRPPDRAGFPLLDLAQAGWPPLS